MAAYLYIDYGPGKGKTYVDESCVFKTREEVERALENISRIVGEARLKRERAKLEAQSKLPSE